MTKVAVLKLDGSKKAERSLPGVFDTPYRPDIIHRAFKASRANRRQAYGPAPMAGAMHSTESIGKGRGTSRVPRIASGNTAGLAPPTVGGRRAHPPTPRRDWTQKVNRKERRLALRSAMAATADASLVKARGHRVAGATTVPVVVDDAFEKVATYKEARKALEAWGLGDDLDRATDGRHIRAGRGKTRGRRRRTPTSLLIVAATTDSLMKGAGNLAGVDVVTPRLLDAERLAPGGVAGRLSVITESALKQLEAMS